MTGSRLADLLDQATPGPWLISYSGNFVVTEEGLVISETGTWQVPMENARLIALAPDMALLLVDMADALADRNLIDYEHGKWRTAAIPESVAVALLARFAAIDEKAGGA